jgi:hypothetical protein
MADLNVGTVRNFLKRSHLDQAFGVGFGIMDYASRRKEGQGVLQAAGGAAISNAVYAMWPEFGLIQMGAQFAPAIISGGISAAKGREFQLQTAANRGFIGGNYHDTKANATMRQAGMQSIANSYANVNTAYGNEARMYSR